MWVPKLLISPVIIRIFCPKTTKFGPNLTFLSIAGSFGVLLVGWLVVVARAVSRKTPIGNRFTLYSEQWHGIRPMPPDECSKKQGAVLKSRKS